MDSFEIVWTMSELAFIVLSGVAMLRLLGVGLPA